MGLLDFVFPKRCVGCGKFGTYLCIEDKEKIRTAPNFCPVCNKAAISGATHARCLKPQSLDGLVCLFSYSTPVKEMIGEFKYRVVKDLQETIVKQIAGSARLKEIDFGGYTLVPTPISLKRQHWRGFNQSGVLGKEIARKLKIGFDDQFLRKIKETKPQAKLHREERLRQVRHTFRSNQRLDRSKILLFDDVWTTGATMKAAAAALKRRGAAKVWGLVLATSKK